VNGINTNLAYSKGWLCNRSRFFGGILFPHSGIGDSIENPKGLTLQDYIKSHRIFAVCVFMISWDEIKCLTVVCMTELIRLYRNRFEIRTEF
jgi:hypothetical protein